MDLIDDKIDGVTTLPASEFNSWKNDSQNLITDTGQNVGTDNFQFSKAGAEYSARGDFYIDSGAPNAYVVSTIGSMKSPIAYNTGMRVRFQAQNTNTGPSTINVALLGVKNIFQADGDPLALNDIVALAYIELTYDGVNFVLISSTSVVSTVPGNNYLINSDFDFIQRGDGQLVSNDAFYVSDRWISDSGVNGDVTINRTLFVPGFNLPNSGGRPKYFLNHNQTGSSNPTRNPALLQRIEDVNTIEDTQGTFTIYLRLNAGVTSFTPQIIQNFGSGGSADVAVVGSTTVLVIGNYVRFTGTFSIPSISGKTVGPGSFLELGFLFDKQSTYNLDISRVKFELGDSNTPYEKLDIESELSNCQRYYEKSYDVETIPGVVTANGSFVRRGIDATSQDIIQLSFPFKVEKRAVPIILWYSPTTGTSNAIQLLGDNIVTVQNGTGTTLTGWPTVTTMPSNVNNRLEAHYTADAEL